MATCAALLLSLAAAAEGGDPGLRDLPIAGLTLQYLDSSDGLQWTASSASAAADRTATIRVAATVPGDVITDLERAGALGGDVWFENRWRNSTAWDRDWTYSVEFSDDGEGARADEPGDGGATGERLLVLDGVKSGASVSLNGAALGVVTDQFLRYAFPVSAHLRHGRGAVNRLEIAFSCGIDTQGRYMGCTGGWDWAPMSTTTTPARSPTFSLGVWKSLYLVTVPAGGAAVSHVVPKTFYRGGHAVTPLRDGAHAGFDVIVDVHLLAARGPPAPGGTVTVVGGWGAGGRVSASAPVPSDPSRWTPSAPPPPSGGGAPSLVEAVVTVRLAADAGDVSLWWPNGMGAQPLYNVSASLSPGAGVGAGAAAAVSDKTSTSGNNTASARSATAAAAAAAAGGGGNQAAPRQIGFREIALVTINDTDADAVAAAASAEGSGNHTVAWRVNGALVFARGANVVPMEEVEGRQTAAAVRSMLRSAAEAGMNALRIWAGGIYNSYAFYAAADSLGLLIYHDLMWIEQGHAPCCPFYACASGWSCAGHAYNATCACDGDAADVQRREMQHQVRRLGAHPSVAVWNGCNECSGTGVYSDFVMRTVAEEDKSRPIWPSCPSNGWVRGVQQLNSRPLPSPPRPDGRPTAAPLVASGGQPPFNTTKPCTACQCGVKGCSTAEHHGPYLGGSGWFTNAGVKDAPVGRTGRGPPVYVPLVDTAARFTLPAGRNATDADCPAAWSRTIDRAAQCRFARGPVGAAAPGSFTSEFGAVAMPSFESLSATLAPEHWSLHSPPMSQRNWPADGAVASFFGADSRLALNRTGERSLRVACYQSQLAQALEIQSRVEVIRSSNSWGALVWQLNDVYPSGSWGSLEYGSSGAAGQVVGGRWRILHHHMEREIWQDNVAACGADGMCYVRSDSLDAVANASVTVGVVDFASGRTAAVAHIHGVRLGAGAGQVHRFCAGAGDPAVGCEPLRSVVAAAGLASCWGDDGSVGCALAIAVEPGASTMTLLAPPERLRLPTADVAFTVEPFVGVGGGAGSTLLPSANADVGEKANGAGGGGGGDDDGAGAGGGGGGGAEATAGGDRAPVATVTLTTNATAVYVTLTTAAQGRFSDNAVLLRPGERREVRFIQFGDAPQSETLRLLKATTRVMHVELSQRDAAA